METQQRTKMWLVWVFGVVFFMAVGAVGAVPPRVTLDVGLSHPYLLSDKTQTAYLRVGLTGYELPKDESGRTHANVAMVIDKSGSMSGYKIEKVKEAAITALWRLDSDDIVSIITYDSTVNVVVPATKLINRHEVIRMIKTITAGGNTALFGGVSKGAREIRKFREPERINRIILLSDGLANVGPSSPSELGSLGKSLSREGISVTTIGVGLDYNEDLMTKLAFNSEGNHYFAENADDLKDVFRKEFDQVLSVVAQNIDIRIECAPGIRPVRLLGRDGLIGGNTASILIQDLYAGHEKFAMLEVEISGSPKKTTRKVAAVKVSYTNQQAHTCDDLASSIEVSFSDSPEMVEKFTNTDVMVDVVKLLASEKNDLAIALRDKGRIEEAKRIAVENDAFLRLNADKLNSEELRDESLYQRTFNENIEKEEDYKKYRKSMRERQYQIDTQQSRSK